jgi:hypothetical protein
MTRSLLRLLALALLLAAARPLQAAAAVRPTRYDLDLSVDLQEKRIDGTARIALRNRGDAPAASLSFRLYRLLTVRSVRSAAGEALPFTQSIAAFEDDPLRQANQLRVTLPAPLAPGAEAAVEIAYGGYLAGYVETGALYIQDRVDDAFTIIREDADAYPTLGPLSYAASRAEGLPQFDYRARITVPDTHVVANGGRLVSRTVSGGKASYLYENLRPAWRMDFAVARFRTLESPKLRIFALPEDAAGAERVRREAQGAMELLSRWYGPLHGAETFTIIEIPEGWGSQADVTSILQTAAAFRDPAKNPELYHEISHLWNAPSREAADCRWNEGLAQFLAALVQENRAGSPGLDAAADRVARDLRERLAKEPRLRTVPMIDYGREEMTGQSYRTGMLMFYVLYRTAGPERFHKIVGGYYQRHHDSGGTTDEFVKEAVAEAGPRAAAIFRDWLTTTAWCERLVSERDVARLAASYR